MNTAGVGPADAASARLRVLSYNIHKGVQGVGPLRRLEIHNLAAALALFDADLIALQEVRGLNRREARHFDFWPTQDQAQVLAPPGFHVLYRSNAITRHGEHGNALISRWPIVAQRHEDVSDHRFEQRGLLHAQVAHPLGALHVMVVHLGLIAASRQRQVAQVLRSMARDVPPAAPLLLAGDFNEWRPWLARTLRPAALAEAGVLPTFPARLPLLALDHVFARGLQPQQVRTPHGRSWWRLSDHLPLQVDWLWPAPT